MGPGGNPLLEAVLYVEGLVQRLEAGEPVRPLLDAFIEQQFGLLTLPLQEDLTLVRRVLGRVQQDPCSRHLPALRAAVDEARRVAGSGPTRSPRANALLGLALAACRDPQLDFGAEASAFGADLAFLAERLLAGGAEGATEEVQEQACRAAEVALEALEGLEELQAAVATAEEARVLVAGQALVAAVRALGDVQATLLELADREIRLVCPRCGHSWDGPRSSCERCGGLPPVAFSGREGAVDVRLGDEPGEGAPPRITENLAVLFDACERFQAGLLEAGPFLEVVAWMEGLLDRARRQGLGDSALAREGQQIFAEGLATLREAGETGEAGLVEPGRRRVWEGAGRLQAGNRS